MKIELSAGLDSKGKLDVKGTGEKIPLPAGDIIILDTNMVFPFILPWEKRKPLHVDSVRFKLRQEQIFGSKKIMEEVHRRLTEREIRITNYIESGLMKKAGFRFGLTNSVIGELLNLGEARSNKSYVLYNLDRIKNYFYEIYLDVGACRDRYRKLSQSFSTNGDFSIVCGAHLLGCDFASDDYRVFHPKVMNRYSKIYSDRWGNKKFTRHDSESLLLELGRRGYKA